MRIVHRFAVLRTLFSKKDFRRLCISQVFGGTGEWLATLALLALVWDKTHSAFASGIVLAFRILPAALVGGFLGALVDKLDRRRVLVACTAGRAVIYGSLPFVSDIAPVLGLALLAEMATIGYVSARDATLPRLVPSEHLATANAVSMGSAFGTMPVGSAIFAGLTWLQARVMSPGVDLALLTAAATLVAATVLLGRIRSAAGIPQRVPATAADTSEPENKIRLRQVLREDPTLRRVVVGAVIAACCGGSLLTLGLAYVRGTLHAGPAAYGGLLTSFCAGALIGTVAVQRARRVLPKMFHLGTGVMGLILLSMAVFPSTVVGYGMGLIFGAAAVVTMLGGITILQDRVHDAVRGRAFAAAHGGLRTLAVGVGLLAAWGANALGAGRVLWAMDGTQVMLAAAGLVLLLAGAVLLRPALTARA
ncbi:MAG: MFS transporter [Actinomycetota bacterium]